MEKPRTVGAALAVGLVVASLGLSAGPSQALERQNCGVQVIDGRGPAMLTAQGVSCSSGWKTAKQAYRTLGGAGTAKVGSFTCKISASGGYGAEKGVCKKGSSKVTWMVAP